MERQPSGQWADPGEHALAVRISAHIPDDHNSRIPYVMCNLPVFCMFKLGTFTIPAGCASFAPYMYGQTSTLPRRIQD